MAPETIESCSGAILAGGAGRRMGRDKALLIVDGETLLARTARVLGAVFAEVVCIGPPREGCDLAALGDRRAGLGPLSGIATALAEARTEWVFVAACDMPLLEPAFIRELWRAPRRPSAAAAIVPLEGDRAHPLCAFWRAELAAAADRALDRGALSVTDFAASVAASYVEFASGDPQASALTNVNTLAEYRSALAQAEGGGR
jgi:molybdopterin-guanine dinucleotide biosynthesis protein A